MTVSDIQRWDVDMHGSMFESDDGPLVFHDAHVAAVAAARTMGYVEGQADMRKYLLADDTHSFTYGYREGVQAARDAVTAVQAERGYDAAINWSEIGNEYAEGWTDLLSLILPAIDALRGGS